jgi:hypothetical protein
MPPEQEGSDMSMTRRWIALAVTAGAMLATAAIPAQAASPAARAGYSVTIGARSSTPGYLHGRTYGYALVLYRDRAFSTARIAGTVAGARAGDVVSLLAEPFGRHSYHATGHTVTLGRNGSVRYAFTVQPARATRYEVRVLTRATLDATSPTAAVYVIPGGSGTFPAKKCRRGACTYSYTVTVVLPAPVYRTESAKHEYLYLAQWRAGRHPARWYYQSAASSASKPVRVNGHEYKQKLTWRFSLSRGTQFAIAACSKDTEAKDGIGLPGHHFCGLRRLSIRQATGYLG